MTSTVQPIFDQATLDANTMSDIALQRELFDLYFGQAPSLFAQLSKSVNAKCRRSWREAAHALKGTARTLGLLQFGDVAGAAEDGAPSAAMLKRLEDSFSAAHQSARAFLAQRDADAA